jgi:DNA-binding transcriptional MerR regulator
MRVSQLAKKMKIAPDTLRYYSRIKLITPQTNPHNGYKEYDASAQKRLSFILGARSLGFSIKDIQQILDESDKGKSSCPMVRKLIEQRLEETRIQFEQMKALRTRMQNAILNWKDKPDKAPTSEMICHLIEDFSSTLVEED